MTSAVKQIACNELMVINGNNKWITKKSSRTSKQHLLHPISRRYLEVQNMYIHHRNCRQAMACRDLRATKMEAGSEISKINFDRVNDTRFERLGFVR
jgi:hypothetical protein